MRTILLFIILLFTSCERYVLEKSDITLSGLYNITKIIITTDTGIISEYTSGVCKNDILPKPFDSIEINNFFMEFSYVDVRFNLLQITPSGKYLWEYGGNTRETQIWTDIDGNNSYFSGILKFSYIPKGHNQYEKVIFTIIDDGIISLVLRSEGTYSNTKKHITLYLSRQ